MDSTEKDKLNENDGSMVSQGASSFLLKLWVQNHPLWPREQLGDVFIWI